MAVVKQGRAFFYIPFLLPFCMIRQYLSERYRALIKIAHTQKKLGGYQK
jgi:hypothetical protein